MPLTPAGMVDIAQNCKAARIGGCGREAQAQITIQVFP